MSATIDDLIRLNLKVDEDVVINLTTDQDPCEGVDLADLFKDIMKGRSALHLPKHQGWHKSLILKNLGNLVQEIERIKHWTEAELIELGERSIKLLIQAKDKQQKPKT